MNNIISLLIWIGFPVILIIVGFWGIKKFGWHDVRQELFVAIITVGIIYLVIILMCIPVYKIRSIAACQKFKVTKEFCETKMYMTESERYALALKAVEQNQWLSTVQYWRKNPIFSIFWTAEIDTLQMIK